MFYRKKRKINIPSELQDRNSQNTSQVAYGPGLEKGGTSTSRTNSSPTVQSLHITSSNTTTASDHLTPLPHLLSDDTFLGLPSLSEHGDCIPDFGQWSTWSCRQRLTNLHLWRRYAEHRYGALHRWEGAFWDDWSRINTNWSNSQGLECFRLAGKRLVGGRLAISYAFRIMEGDLPDSISDVRDIYLQSVQFLGDLFAAVSGLQARLDVANEQYKLMCK